MCFHVDSFVVCNAICVALCGFPHKRLLLSVANTQLFNGLFKNLLSSFFSPNRQGRSELRSSGRSVSPSPIRYNSPGGLATHLSHKVCTSKSSLREAAASSSSTSGLKLSNLTPPGSRKYGTYSMGGHYERSDSSGSGPKSAATSSKTPPVARKVGRASSPPLSGKIYLSILHNRWALSHIKAIKAQRLMICGKGYCTHVLRLSWFRFLLGVNLRFFTSPPTYIVYVNRLIWSYLPHHSHNEEIAFIFDRNLQDLCPFHDFPNDDNC